MKTSQLTPHDAVWFCRRLAAALPGRPFLLVALETVAGEAPPPLQGRLASAVTRVGVGDPLSSALHGWGLPAYACESVYAGECRDQLPEALARVAEQLEAETRPALGNARLHAFSLALARVSTMLACGVAVPDAVECAAGSADVEEVREVLDAAGEAFKEGVALGEALARLVPDLPSPTLQMICEGEAAGQLDFALSVASDYLFEQAKASALATRTREVSHG